MSTSDWVAKNIRGGKELSGDTLSLVADFTLMWALFEGTEVHGENRVVIDELTQIAARVAGRFPQELLGKYVDYWAHRYIEGGETNHRFEKLHFTHDPHKIIVKNVLTGNEKNAQRMIHALLLIIYRLRNNLFHGEKDVHQLDGQRENFKQACNVIKTVLESSGRYIFYNA